LAAPVGVLLDGGGALPPPLSSLLLHAAKYNSGTIAKIDNVPISDLPNLRVVNGRVMLMMTISFR
jgi:hypothetical protein